MSIGYACLALGVHGSGMRSCTMRNAGEELLLSLIGDNLDSLERLIRYNIRNGIRLFRISSDLIPFGSSLSEGLPWQDVHSDKLESIGGEIRRSGMRVSMHPGQYTVLNSTDENTADGAARDPDYHAKVLDCLGLGPEHKMVLHLGGVYGDKERAKERFVPGTGFWIRPSGEGLCWRTTTGCSTSRICWKPFPRRVCPRCTTTCTTP